MAMELGELTEQSAECEEGMPPESTIAFKSQTPFRHRLVNICKGKLKFASRSPYPADDLATEILWTTKHGITLHDCARNQPQKPAINT